MPCSTTTPKVLPAYAGSAMHSSIRATTASASTRLRSRVDVPSVVAPMTLTDRSGGSRSPPNWRSGTNGSSA